MPKASSDIRGYSEASSQWEIDRLFRDLGSIKKQYFAPNSDGLSLTEKEYLCLFLNGKSLEEIADLKAMSVKTLSSVLSPKLYRYLKTLLENTPSKSIEFGDWRDIYRFCQDAGYKVAPSAVEEPPQSSNLSPPPLGWIWLGFAQATSHELPPTGTKLIAAGQFVTISPAEVPHPKAKVTTVVPVNIRLQRLQEADNYTVMPKKVGVIQPDTELIVLDLHAFLPTPAPESAPSSVIPYTRIWAQVGLHFDV
ncbi:hypothetical protein [Pseudanabaena sp. PCC 6802]|uniref:hypothetical protein n=1 Tax=Pseudanabaena sp. PCC 6802 TaxID=118173 RepID=UPI001CEDACF2|nr:hypothetical protein [Pseudanabaena sp. PCC 6802]